MIFSELNLGKRTVDWQRSRAPPLPTAGPTSRQLQARLRGPSHPVRSVPSRPRPLAPRAGTFGAIGPLRPPASHPPRRGNGSTGSVPGPAVCPTLLESAWPLGPQGAFPATARQCRAAGSRGSAPGTSLAPRPTWNRRVTGPGPTAAPRSTAWRSCCAARAGKDGAWLKGMAAGHGRPSRVLSHFPFPPEVPVRLSGRRADLVLPQRSGVSRPRPGPHSHPLLPAFQPLAPNRTKTVVLEL